MTKITKKVSIFSFYFVKNPEETIDWNSNALPEGVMYLEKERVKKFQVSAKRWREKIGGRFERKDGTNIHLNTISTEVLAWMVIAQLLLPVYSVKSVLECTVRLMNSQAEAKSDKKFIGSAESAAAKSSWTPRKSTKVLRPIKPQKNWKSHSVTEKGPSCGKIDPTEPRGVEGMNQSRDAPAEKRRESRVQRSSTKTEMLFLWCFSAPCCERAFWQLPEHIAHSRPNYALTRMELITATKKEWNAKIGYDGGLITWISAKPTDWTPEVNFYTSWIMEENSVLCGELRTPRCPGFFRLVLHALLHLRCVQQQYEVRICVYKHKETCHIPSHETTNKHGETRYRLNCHEERCNRKKIHTHFLKDRNCEMQEGKNYLDYQETHKRSHRGAKLKGWDGIISWNLAKNQWEWTAELLKSHRHLTVQKELGLLK